MYSDKILQNDRRIPSVLIVVCGIAVMAVAALTLLFGLEQAGLVDLHNLTGHPHYRLR